MTQRGQSMRLLFVKHAMAWPRASGHDVHAYHMIAACAALGHTVSLATSGPVPPAALAGLVLERHDVLDGAARGPAVGGSWLQRRYRTFYGIPDSRLAALGALVRETKPDAVVVVGLEVLPYLAAVSSGTRIWYAADEWVWHHLSQVRPRRDAVRHLLDAAVKGVYERAHARLVDRVWVVSDTERRAMRWLAGMRRIDVLPNGVDGEYFRPGDEIAEPRSAVFWGRLDFGPNIQALEWFCGRVWPLVVRETPGARFTILGFRPSDAVRRLAAGAPGISLVPDLPDIRSTARRHAVVVLPFISGGGIKNKLLEAAALGQAIVCTPMAAR